MLAECKTTTKDHYTLQLEDLLKLRKQAAHYADWVFQVEFSNGSHPNKFAVISWATLMELWRHKPTGYMGLSPADFFQIGKSFNVRHDDIIKKWGSTQGLTPAFRITFNHPDDKEAGPAGKSSFALISWVVYLVLSDAAEKAQNAST
jgi:hypothetical protein